MRTPSLIRPLLVITLLLMLATASIGHLRLHPPSLAGGLRNIAVFVSESVPPDGSILTTALAALLETVEIAFLGTFFGLVISLPLGILASRNLFPPATVVPTRFVLATIRTLPALLWAILFVIITGLGAFAGVLATAFYTVGYLGKLQYESIEGIDRKPAEAMEAMGAHTLQIIRYAILPPAANHLLSQALFMFEHNIRASSILGFVGAGGIGFYLLGYLRLLEYRKVCTLLLLTFATVLIIDVVSFKIRDRYLTR